MTAPIPLLEHVPEDVRASDELIAATRRLMESAATSDLPPARLSVLAAQLHQLSDELSTQRRDRVRRIPFDQTLVARVKAGAHWRMFAFNPFLYPLSIAVSDGTARAELVPGALHEGPPDLMHGGFAAALLDALLGTLVQVEVAPSYTAGLDLRFPRGAALDRPIVVSGRLLRREGRKTWAEGEIVQDGLATTTATGVFVTVDQGA